MTLPLAQHCLAITADDLQDKRTIWLQVDGNFGSIDLQDPPDAGFPYWLNDRSSGVVGSRDFIAHLASRLSVLEGSLGTGGVWSVVWDDPLPGYYVLQRDSTPASAELLISVSTVDPRLIGFLPLTDKQGFEDQQGRFIIPSSTQAGRLWLPPKIPMRWNPWTVNSGSSRMRPFDGEMITNLHGSWTEWDIEYQNIPGLWVRTHAITREDHRQNLPGMNWNDDNIALESSWSSFYTAQGPWVFYPDRNNPEEWYETEMFELEHLNRMDAFCREMKSSPEQWKITLRLKNWIEVL